MSEIHLTKVCLDCGEEKPLSEYYLDKNGGNVYDGGHRLGWREWMVRGVRRVVRHKRLGNAYFPSRRNGLVGFLVFHPWHNNKDVPRMWHVGVCSS